MRTQPAYHSPVAVNPATGIGVLRFYGEEPYSSCSAAFLSGAALHGRPGGRSRKARRSRPGTPTSVSVAHPIGVGEAVRQTNWSLPTMNEITLAVVDGRITTTSRQIAEHFGKQHSHVLRAIANLECSAEFRQSNFGSAHYLDEQGKPRQEYTLTRDGFTFLCMGFTGRDAAAWKERYIAAFNAMETELRKVGAGKTAKLGRGLRESIQQAIAAELAKALPAVAAPALPPPPTRDYASAKELPFVNRLMGNNSEWQFWFFRETKGSWAEAEAVADFHWREFCNFARGQQPGRTKEAIELLEKVLDYMARWYGQHPAEAEQFRHHMIVSLVDGLRGGAGYNAQDQRGDGIAGDSAGS